MQTKAVCCFYLFNCEMNRTVNKKHTGPTRKVKYPKAALVTPPSPQLTSLMLISLAIFPLTLIWTDLFELTPGSAPDTGTMAVWKLRDIKYIMTHIFIFLPFLIFQNRLLVKSSSGEVLKIFCNSKSQPSIIYDCTVAYTQAEVSSRASLTTLDWITQEGIELCCSV